MRREARPAVSWQEARMADGDSSTKRLKTAENGVVITGLRGKVAELESEIEQLRRRVHQLEGNHEVLPVVVAATVDLSRIDTSVVTQISSFVGTSHEL